MVKQDQDYDKTKIEEVIDCIDPVDKYHVVTAATADN